MTWRAYAHAGDFGRDVRLLVGTYPTGPGEPYLLVTEINSADMVVQTVTSEEAAAPAHQGLRLSHEAAEAVYHALHRLYGQDADPAVIEALKVERERVNKILDKVIK